MQITLLIHFVDTHQFPGNDFLSTLLQLREQLYLGPLVLFSPVLITCICGEVPLLLCKNVRPRTGSSLRQLVIFESTHHGKIIFGYLETGRWQNFIGSKNFEYICIN